MRAFAGIAVYPRKVQPRRVTKVGVWINEPLSTDQGRMIRSKTETATKGKISVREFKKEEMIVTTVALVGRLQDTKAARQMAIIIAKAVEEVTGIRSALVELPDYFAVGKALHCA